MILNKLRRERNWSQEQLATMARLSVRTIQRIESGHSASLESLKSLAAVLEVKISTLEQEITMIDKNSEEWKKLPWLFRLNFIGSETSWVDEFKRKTWVKSEIFSVSIGAILCLLGIFSKSSSFLSPLIIGQLFFVNAYITSIITRMGDKYSIWTKENISYETPYMKNKKVPKYKVVVIACALLGGIGLSVYRRYREEGELDPLWFIFAGIALVIAVATTLIAIFVARKLLKYEEERS
ncbi:MAG: helix-turn-helix domain-containing protein [Cellvibrionaceae bacterium]